MTSFNIKKSLPRYYVFFLKYFFRSLYGRGTGSGSLLRKQRILEIVNDCTFCLNLIDLLFTGVIDALPAP